eukprot:3145240-Rhodomonas_salina.2
MMLCAAIAWEDVRSRTEHSAIPQCKIDAARAHRRTRRSSRQHRNDRLKTTPSTVRNLVQETAFLVQIVREMWVLVFDFGIPEARRAAA